jgi:APA family basic amino acid/polyamine antiporter
VSEATAGDDRHPPEPGFRRTLGPFDATCVVIGAVIGVGIFFNPTQVAKLAGSEGLALLAWGAGGVIALVGALTFAELGGLYPRAGGQYGALRDAFGAPLAFLHGFSNLTAIQAGSLAIIAIVCAQNLGFAATGGEIAPRAVMSIAVALISGLAGANILGVRFGAAIQNVTVIAKSATLLFVTALAIFAAPAAGEGSAVPTPGVDANAGGLAAFLAALVPTLFAFGGWHQGLWIGGEVRDPERTVPRAIVLGVVVVIALYLLVNGAYFRLLGHGGVAGSGALAAEAVSRALPGLGSRIVAGAVAFSAFGVLNVQFLSGPRLTYAMARDGRFFGAFGVLHARTGTPVPAILLLAAIALALLLAAGAEGVDRLLTGVVTVDATFFALTAAAVIVLRRRDPARARPVRVPLYPWVPILCIAGQGLAIVGSFQNEATRSAAWIGAAWLAAGLAIYAVAFRGKSRG